MQWAHLYTVETATRMTVIAALSVTHAARIITLHAPHETITHVRLASDEDIATFITASGTTHHELQASLDYMNHLAMEVLH